MAKFIAVAKKFVRGEEGAALVEYALLVGLIAVVSISVLTVLGAQVFSAFDTTQQSIGGATKT
ncbi:MAG: Flp family type IVb pilin, partial [Planctomycetia bacterium]|nr:Flp family type IVb pilin [Planctomycetia bacterium]